MVWKFPESEVDAFDGEVSLIEGSTQVTYISEMSIMSFIKCIGKINEYSHLMEY